MDKNYITTYYTYFQYARQNVSFSLPPPYQEWFQMFFGGIILLIVPEVHYQTSYLNVLSMILIMKEMLILLRQSSLSSKNERNKTKRDRQSDQQTRILRSI